VLLERTLHDRTPAAADVEQRHAGLEVELAQRQVDLGHLRLFERHVVSLEVGAAVGPRGILEQPEEVIGEVVVSLHLFEVRLHLLARLRRLHSALNHSPTNFRPTSSDSSFLACPACA
jgi:hypothetical protein